MNPIRPALLRLTFALDRRLGGIATWLAGPPPGVVGLMFHAVTMDRDHPEFCRDMHFTHDELLQIIRDFKEAGYRFLSLRDLESPLDPRGRYALLTFDDGNASDLPLLDLLEAEEVPGNFFIATGRLASSPQDPRNPHAPLSHEDLQRIGRHPWAWIGNHTHSHPDLRTLDAAEIAEEIRASRALLATLPQHVPSAIAFPYGRWNEAAVHQLAQAGFRSFFLTSLGLNPVPRKDDRFRIVCRYGFSDLGALADQSRWARHPIGLRLLLQRFRNPCLLRHLLKGVPA